MNPLKTGSTRTIDFKLGPREPFELSHARALSYFLVMKVTFLSRELARMSSRAMCVCVGGQSSEVMGTVFFFF